MLKLRKNKKGFTLVELIVVIAIMAVLAGTVAGVTVSQLNKRTDEANHNQAKKIADTIYEELLANVGGTDITPDTPDSNPIGASMQEIVEEAFGTSIIAWAKTGVTGNNLPSLQAGKNYRVQYHAKTDAAAAHYTVEYKGKQGNHKGDISYTITSTDGVKKVDNYQAS